MELRAGAAVAIAIALTAIATGWSTGRAGVVPTYSVDFHSISSGGSALRNGCFSLIGTVGQAAPGYSSATSGAPTFSLYAGFWSAAQTATLDEIFFTGFEGC